MPDHPPPAASYEIFIRGHLGETMLHAFPELRAERRGNLTVLRGVLADQSALHGVLSRIEALGLELLKVRRCRRHERPGPPHRTSSSKAGSAGARRAMTSHDSYQLERDAVETP